MRGYRARVTTTEVSRQLRAPRERVYRALVDPGDVARWRFPAGMTCEVHEFEAREGGAVRVSLTYDEPGRTGKSHGRTDTYRGRFVTLVPNELVVEIDEFETDDPALAGEMTVTIRLVDAGSGRTELHATHAGLPEGVSAADNATGWEEALDRLAALVETPRVTERLMPDRGEADSDVAWGDVAWRDSPYDDDRRLETERPPHYDR